MTGIPDRPHAIPVPSTPLTDLLDEAIRRGIHLKDVMDERGLTYDDLFKHK